jgi:hypothetical protein
MILQKKATSKKRLERANTDTAVGNAYRKPVRYKNAF